MYDAPTPPKVTLNADGELVREYDRNPNRTTLITDEVRVYKEVHGKIEHIGLIQLKEDIHNILLQIT